MQSLFDYIDSLSIISTHEHHEPFPPKEDPSLELLFAKSYVGWCNADFLKQESRGYFLDLMCANSYFIWHERALDNLFNFGGRITEENWDSISEKVKAVLPDPKFHEFVYTSKCKYSRAILDAYWNPGSDNDRPDLYVPTFRINSFLYGNHPLSKDHNGNNAQILYGECKNLDEYLAMLDSTIGTMKAKGCVCLKSALAYDRALDFKEQSKKAAERVFMKPPNNVAPEELKIFGNYIFDHICTLALKHDLPIQNHTGLGRLGGSNPMNLIPMIEKHPHTKFVLFHGGYPWMDEICALAHNYHNVFVDLCWLPAISTSASERMLHSLLESARNSSCITWGGDCWMVTESYAYTLAIRQVLKKVLSEKIAEGYLTEERAKRLAERILFVNAKELYKL